MLLPCSTNQLAEEIKVIHSLISMDHLSTIASQNAMQIGQIALQALRCIATFYTTSMVVYRTKFRAFKLLHIICILNYSLYRSTRNCTHRVTN